MAQQLKADQTETVRLTKKGYVTEIKSVNSAKDKAKEHNGTAAKATRDYCDANGLSKQAFTTVAKLSKKEAPEVNEFLREVLMGCDYMGYFDSGDMFDDDPVEMMRKIVAKKDERQANRDAQFDGKPKGEPDEAAKEGKHLASVN